MRREREELKDEDSGVAGKSFRPTGVRQRAGFRVRRRISYLAQYSNSLTSKVDRATILTALLSGQARFRSSVFRPAETISRRTSTTAETHDVSPAVDGMHGTSEAPVGFVSADPAMDVILYLDSRIAARAIVILERVECTESRFSGGRCSTILRKWERGPSLNMAVLQIPECLQVGQGRSRPTQARVE